MNFLLSSPLVGMPNIRLDFFQKLSFEKEVIFWEREREDDKVKL